MRKASRDLRWARNVVRKWSKTPGSWQEACQAGISREMTNAIGQGRWEKAVALLLAHKLAQD